MLGVVNNMKNILIVFITLVWSCSTFAMPPSSFDPSVLDSAKTSTIGNTQNLLQKRGSVECLSCHPRTAVNYPGVITTADIMQATLDADYRACMEWEPVGVCIWMTCVLVACDFQASVKVKNYVPELLVQAYDRANGEPWTESQNLNEISQGDADSSWVTKIIGMLESFDVSSVGVRGGTSTQAKGDKHANLKFKLVDAYGSPGSIAYLAANSTGYVCEGVTTPFFPYYISNLDSIAWRWDVPEMFYPQSLAAVVSFGIWDLGGLSNNYGPIYPRHGFMMTTDPVKASVLASFRAAHFITRDFAPHLYFSINEGSRDGWWSPGPLEKDRPTTGKWQMLYPNKETTCESFPYSAQPSGSRRSTDGSYVWNFWREYKCCERKGAVLVFHSG